LSFGHENKLEKNTAKYTMESVHLPKIQPYSMKFVSEKIIDAIIDELDNLSEENYEQQMEAFAEAQPVVIAYLFDDENTHLLTEDEKGFLHYICLIMWLSYERVNGKTEPVGENEIGEAEEKNYAVLEASTATKFRQRVDAFFEEYPQEDLLAFIEEAVLEDENEPDALVTKEGREPLFIAAKSVLDCFLQG
jgi:hypothetical protein